MGYRLKNILQAYVLSTVKCHLISRTKRIIKPCQLISDGWARTEELTISSKLLLIQIIFFLQYWSKRKLHFEGIICTIFFCLNILYQIGLMCFILWQITNKPIHDINCTVLSLYCALISTSLQLTSHAIWDTTSFAILENLQCIPYLYWLV